MNRRARAGTWLANIATSGLLACASASGPSQGIQTLYMPGSNITMMPGTEPYTKTIAAPIDQVWHYVAAAYDSLTIPLTTLQPKTHIVGNEGFKAHQKLGKERLSKFFECGTTQEGENADSYELYIVLITQLEADGEHLTKVTTTVQAAAKPMNFAQDYSRCQSKFVLETRITDIVRSHFAK